MKKDVIEYENQVRKIFSSDAVKSVETEILTLQYDTEKNWLLHNSYEVAIEHLLSVRRDILNKQFVMNEYYKQLLYDFNEALKQQVIEMRMKAIKMFDTNIAIDIQGNYELTAKCFLGYNYSKIHPVQTMRAKKMWAMLNGTIDDFMPIYDDGATSLCISNWFGQKPDIPSENHLLYLDEELDNWNDELDSEWTNDMHLIHPFHNLYSHMEFSIFDLLWVRDFNIELHVECDYDTYDESDEDDDLDWKKFDYND